jgi:hypothetical protein
MVVRVEFSRGRDGFPGDFGHGERRPSSNTDAATYLGRKRWYAEEESGRFIVRVCFFCWGACILLWYFQEGGVTGLL